MMRQVLEEFYGEFKITIVKQAAAEYSFSISVITSGQLMHQDPMLYESLELVVGQALDWCDDQIEEDEQVAAALRLIARREAQRIARAQRRDARITELVEAPDTEAADGTVD
jgi:hypothetical protein